MNNDDLVLLRRGIIHFLERLPRTNEAYAPLKAVILDKGGLLDVLMHEMQSLPEQYRQEREQALETFTSEIRASLCLPLSTTL